ncbi:hypothetical protein D5072_09200 [Dickeya dianthicola]|uniref:Uncharacterized protein n=1 Tax=Dickeya dianthicola TaxID=204039 RepID=A0AAX1C0Y9_9GAMM|nr:hypothetical protein DF213_21000 [Dickeya dianthicola]RJL69323.1 hypothetical protein D5072_09200 [Dickeya dianthicola]RJL71896.1 hypothetical protein D5077_11800 [Dickeya dianthicola]
MQRQAMDVALHIVLLPFLNYCIAQLIHTMPTFCRLFFARDLARGILEPVLVGCLWMRVSGLNTRFYQDQER